MSRRYKLKLFITLLAVCLILGVATEGSAARKKYLSFGSASPASTGYFLGAGIANLFNKYVPEVRVIAESTAASEENFRYIVRKKLDMGFCTNTPIAPALERKMDLSGIRLMAMGGVTPRQWIVRKESPVKCIGDFKGTRISMGQPGSGAMIITKNELAILGLTLNDLKPFYLSVGEALNAIKDGNIDVGSVHTMHPTASLFDLARQIPIRLIPYSEEEMKVLISRFPYYVKIVIPRGTYPGVDTDTPTLANPLGIFCREDLSEDLVFQLMKALYDHPEQMAAIHPQGREYTLNNVFRGTGYTTQYIPFHPGAIKYLKEKGVWKEPN